MTAQQDHIKRHVNKNTLINCQVYILIHPETQHFTIVKFWRLENFLLKTSEIPWQGPVFSRWKWTQVLSQAQLPLVTYISPLAVKQAQIRDWLKRSKYRAQECWCCSRRKQEVPWLEQRWLCPFALFQIPGGGVSFAIDQLQPAGGNRRLSRGCKFMISG